MRAINGTRILLAWKETGCVVLISALAFTSFYYNSYFSSGYKGMLAYELKDSLSHFSGQFQSIDQGSTLYWDPIYFQYSPRHPQNPIHSPITRLILLAHRILNFSNVGRFLPVILSILAILQVLCCLTMYLFLRYCNLGFMPSVLGGLCYAYNHQTFVFGIRHGYERISVILFAPLVLISFFKALDDSTSPIYRRIFIALSALLLGIILISNGDVKPVFYFCIFMVIGAIFFKPFRLRNILILLTVFALAGSIYLVQGLPTYYAFREMVRGQANIQAILEYSLRPATLLLTHFSTIFTDRPDYPWENTVEFSISMTLLVILGLLHIFRHRLRLVIPITLIVCYIWIMGKYTPFAPILGWCMNILALRHPVRIAILLYFCYGFLAALGARHLSPALYNKVIVSGLLIVPVVVLILYLQSPATIPSRYLISAFLSWGVIFAVVYRVLNKRFIWLLALFFLLERTTIFSTLAESNVCDPTNFYRYDEIYQTHSRVSGILKDPDYRNYRVFFGTRDFSDLFSHNYYLNAFIDGIRPIFPYFEIEEEMKPVVELKEALFNDWSSPMWDLMNVKYFVDLDKYFNSWDEEDTCKEGLEHLEVVDEYVKINPGAEKEVFVRYRTELTDDKSFLDSRAAGEFKVKEIAYLNDADAGSMIPFSPELSEGGEDISVIERKTDEITVEVTVPRPAFVVFSEYWFFPWSVEVDGEEAPLIRTYNILQGVKIPGGKHRVRFYFNSRHWKFVLPFIVSYGTVLILLLYIAYCCHKDRKRKERNIGVPE